MFGNLQKNPIIIESTTTHTTTTRTIKVSNDIMGKIQKAQASGAECNININVKDDIGADKSRFNPFEQKTNHKFRGQHVS